MRKYGGPENGATLPEWNINDDGLGMLTGTLKVFIDGNGKTNKAPTGAMEKAAALSLFNKYQGNNGLSNPKDASGGGGLGEGIPKTGDAHPYDSRLRCFGVSVERTSLGYGYAEAQYVGLLNDPSGIEWEITANTEDSPIETHPDFLLPEGYYVDNAGKPTGETGAKFGVITKSGINPQTKGPYWNLKNVCVDGPTQSFKGFRASEEIIKKNLVGVESYKTPMATYRVSYTTAKKEMFEWALKNLGRIFDIFPSFVDKGIGSGGDSSTPAGLLSTSTAQTGTPSTSETDSSGKTTDTTAKNVTNFLLTSVSVSQASGLFKVSVEFMRSGPKGWNSVVYMPADPHSWDSAESSGAVTNK